MNTPVLYIDLRNVDLKTKKFKEQTLKEIVAYICALMNSDGGKIELQMKTGNNKQIIRIIEQLCISIVGSQVTVSNLNIKAAQRKVVCEVKKTDFFITAHYNVYLPTETQVVAVSSLEGIKDKLLNRKSIQARVSLGSHCKQFERYQSCGLDENKVVQLKFLKDSPSKCTKLIKRIKNNKLTMYVSAFANYNGGHIYYGITDDGIVIGELIPNKDVSSITKEIEKALKKMIWPEQIGQPKRGEHWDIFFVPVVDENSKPCPSTFVIVIYIASCLGGVFTEAPECYEMVKGKVEKMSFATWKKRTLGPVELNCTERHTDHCDCQGSEFNEGSECYETVETTVKKMPLSRKEKILQSAELFQLDKIPSTDHRITWSSTKMRRLCTQLDQKLNQSINYGKSILTISREVVKRFPGLVEVKLLVLFKKAMVCYRSNCFKKAKVLLKEYDDLLPRATEVGIFNAIRVYIEAALHRAQREVEVLKQILPDVLYTAEQTDPGLISSAIYLLAATVTSLFESTADDQKGKLQEYSSYLLPIRALEHLQYVQDSPIERADLEQKAHITLALFYLGCDISGVLTKKYVDGNSLEKAKSRVTAVIKSIEDGHSMTYYREVQFNLVKSILSYRYSEVQVQDDRKLFFLKEAFKFSKNAETLASECHFEEMLNWARAFMALCTEGLLRTHFGGRFKSSSRDVP